LEVAGKSRIMNWGTENPALALLQRQSSHVNEMGQLRCGTTTKVAYARSAVVNSMGQ